METVEMQNTNGTRNFVIWGGVAVHTNVGGLEYHKELNAHDLVAGTVLDNIKKLVSSAMPDIVQTSSSVDCNGIALYVKLDNARYDYIELKGWEV